MICARRKKGVFSSQPLLFTPLLLTCNVEISDINTGLADLDDLMADFTKMEDKSMLSQQSRQSEKSHEFRVSDVWLK